MACEGRARNRMLRKRWIVRNPVVGEDDITQLILARPFNTSWLHRLFLSVAKGGGGKTLFYMKLEDTFTNCVRSTTRGCSVVCVI